MSTVQEEPSTPTGHVLASERIAGTILPRNLGTFSLVAILIGIVFFATNASLMSGAGAAGYTFWILGFLTFLVPGAITTNQLGRMFPGEGSIYVWTTKAMGPFFGFLAGFSAWFPGVIGLVATAVGAIPFVQYLAPTALAATWQQGLVLIGIIAFSGAIACLRFRITRTMTNIVFLCYGAVIALLALAGVLAWVHGHATPVSYTAQNWAPNGGNFTFYGVAILGLLGIEVPLNMGAEITHARAITRYLLWGSALILVLYLLATFGVLSAVPLPQQGNLDAVVVAIQLGIGGGAGQILADLAAVLYIGFFVWVTVVFNYSFARLPFTSGLDSRLPLVVSRVNRFQIPWVALAIQSGIAIGITALIYLLAPLFVRQSAPGDLSTMVYDVIQAALTIIWCISLLFLFLTVVIIARKNASAFARQQVAPGWVFYLCAVLGSLASLVAIIVTMQNPWTPLLVESVWLIWIVCLIVLCLAIGGLLFSLGERRSARIRTDEEVIAAVTPH